MYEEVRKSLEMCSIEKDIEYFVTQRKTGQTPPGEWNGGVGVYVSDSISLSRHLLLTVEDTCRFMFYFLMIPLAPIMYENFYCPQKNAAPQGKATGPNLAR